MRKFIEQTDRGCAAGKESADSSLRNRANRVIPNGMYGHMSAQRLPSGYPQFMDHGTGCRVWDANGKEYIDFMCGWGPIILGRKDPLVDKAVQDEIAHGDLMNGPRPVMVRLAEELVDMIPHADWSMFAKNGTDATTCCISIARATTGRRKILVARGAYHGSAPWCSPSIGGVLPEDRAHLVYYDYNSMSSIRQAIAGSEDDLAGILVSPVEQRLGVRQSYGTKEFAEGVRALADSTGAALIMDEVRCGFRIDLSGTWASYGVQPDLAAWSKAMGNGQPIAAVTGRNWLRNGASKIYVTGSFWYSGIPMAASLATLKILRETDAIQLIRQAGARFSAGLQSQAESFGFDIEISGPAQMPLLLFSNDDDQQLGSSFSQLCIENGVYIHPAHNWFISAAHQFTDIDDALDKTNNAFRDLANSVS